MQAELLDYLRVVRGRLAASTFVHRRSMLKSYVQYLEKAQKGLLEASSDDIRGYLLSLVRCNPNTRQARWSAINDFYAFHRLNPNPAEAVRVHAPRYRRLVRVAGSAQVQSRIAAMSGKDAQHAARNRLMAELAYGSGLRLCELQRMNIEDIDVGERCAQVVGKGEKVRVVPLTDKSIHELAKYLLLHPRRRGPLFVGANGRRLGSQAIAVTFRSYTGRSPHHYRHACATHMLRNGCDIRYIQQLLGHQCLTTTQTYTDITKEDLRKVVERAHPASCRDR